MIKNAPFASLFIIIPFFFYNCSIIRCADGNKVKIPKHPDKQFQQTQKLTNVSINASIGILDKLKLPELSTGTKGQVIVLRQKLDQYSSRTQDLIKAALDAFKTTPCDEEIHKRYFDLLTDINKESAEIEKLKESLINVSKSSSTIKLDETKLTNTINVFIINYNSFQNETNINQKKANKIQNLYNNEISIEKKREKKRINKKEIKKNKFDYVLGIGNLGYDFIGSRSITGTFLHAWFKFADQRVIGFSIYGAKYKKLNNFNYTISNWGDRTTKYVNYGRSYPENDSRLDTNITNSIGNVEGPCYLFGFFIPSLQINLFTFPKDPIKFNLTHFLVSVYLESYPYEFIVQNFNFPHYKNNTNAEDAEITESSHNSYLGFVFKSWETGLKIENSLFFINLAYYWRLSSSKQFVQNRGDNNITYADENFGGKYYKQNGYSEFSFTIGLNCDFFCKKRNK